MSGHILAIDPGPVKSGWVRMAGRRICDTGVDSNIELLRTLRALPAPIDGGPPVAIEMIASYGMPVGAEVFLTCVWIGRFIEARQPHGARLITRAEVKMHLCGNARARDANVRQALIDLFGPKGTKAAPGGTYGVNTHAWSALGVAATALGIQPEPVSLVS